MLEPDCCNYEGTLVAALCMCGLPVSSDGGCGAETRADMVMTLCTSYRLEVDALPAARLWGADGSFPLRCLHDEQQCINTRVCALDAVSSWICCCCHSGSGERRTVSVKQHIMNSSELAPAQLQPLLQPLPAHACSKCGFGDADLAVARLGMVGGPTPADTSGTD